MSEHDEHSSFIKTPQQLIAVVTMANRAGGNLKEPAANPAAAGKNK